MILKKLERVGCLDFFKKLWVVFSKGSLHSIVHVTNSHWRTAALVESSPRQSRHNVKCIHKCATYDIFNKNPT